MLTGLLFRYGYIEYFNGLFLKWAGAPWGDNVVEHCLFGILPWRSSSDRWRDRGSNTFST